MSILIDDLIKQTIGLESKTKDNSYWYYPKPYGFFGWKGLIQRIKDSWRVLFGSSRAFHYKEDEE